MTTFTVINRAEDGTYEDDFDTLDEAIDYLHYQTSYTIDKPSVENALISDNHYRLTDNDGRTFTLITEEN